MKMYKKNMLILLSVDEIFLRRYVNLFTNFRAI